MGNKYGAKRTYSALADRTFDSKAEARRADDLVLLERAGEISELEFQPRWVLSRKPLVSYRADFRYKDNGRTVVEDVKGKDTDASRVRRAWLKQLHGIEVEIIR